MAGHGILRAASIARLPEFLPPTDNPPQTRLPWKSATAQEEAVQAAVAADAEGAALQKEIAAANDKIKAQAALAAAIEQKAAADPQAIAIRAEIENGLRCTYWPPDCTSSRNQLEKVMHCTARFAFFSLPARLCEVLSVWLPAGVILAASLVSAARAEPAAPADLRGLAGQLQGNLKVLAEARDGLAAQLQSRLDADGKIAPPADLYLRFAEGADHEEMLVVLNSRGGRWARAYATVPAWRQETYGERRGFYIENKTRYVWRDKFRWSVQPLDLALSGDSLNGSMETFLGLNQLREERLPPGTPRVFHTGEVFSWLDRIGYLVHERLRKEQFAVAAQISKDACEFDLALEDIIAGQRPIYITFQIPETGLARPTAWTPTFNGGYHTCDASGVGLRGDKVAGTLKISLKPDAWFPKSPIDLTVSVEGKVEFGRFRGTYRSSWEGKEIAGALTGKAGRTVLGRFQANGEMGGYCGLVQGMACPARDKIAAFFQTVAADKDGADVAGLIRQAHQVYRQVRALNMALRQYPLALEDAWDQCSVSDVRWGRDGGTTLAKEDLADISGYVTSLTAAAKAAAAGEGTWLRGVQAPADPTFGPFGGSEALPEGPKGYTLPADTGVPGPQKWCHLPEWLVAGPLSLSDNVDHNAAEAPDLFLSERGQYVLNPACLPKEQKPKPGEDALAGWRPIKAPEGELEPAWSHAVGRGAFRGSLWFAAADVVSDKDREVWISVAAMDHAKLWVNGRLVWVGGELAWPYRHEQESIFRIALRKGTNRLLVRCREDRSLTWIRLHLCVRGQPKAGDEGLSDPPPPEACDAAGDGAGRFPGARPPLAWDLDKGVNVSWKAPLPGAATSRPVAVGGRIYITCEPSTLVCMDQENGKVLWKAASDVPAPDPRSRAEDAVVGNGRQVWACHRGGVVVACDAQGKKLWSLATEIDSATLRMAGGRLIVQGLRGGDKKAEPVHILLALDPLSGKDVWKQQLAEPYRPIHVLRLARDGKTFAGLLTESLQVRDAATGEVVLNQADLDRTREGGIYLADGMIHFTGYSYKYAGRFFLDADGQLGCRFAWHNFYATKDFHSAAPAVGVGRWFLTTSQVQEDRPGHSPVALREMNIFDRRTGEPVGRIKPLCADVPRVFTPPLAAGSYVFVQVAGTSDGPGQMVVVDASGWPTVIARNALPRKISGQPVFEGTRMFLRTADELICIAVTTPEGRRFQDERIAATLMEYVGAVPRVDRLTGASPLAEIPVSARLPLSDLSDGRTLPHWLVAGPLPPKVEPQDVEQLAGLKPETGATVTLGGVTKPFAPLAQQWVKVSVTRYSYHLFEGLGMGLADMRRSIDVAGFLQDNKDQSLVLFSVAVNSRPRLVTLAAPAKGVDLWLAGQKVKPMSPLHLAAGAYPLMVLVRPEFLAGGEPLTIAFPESDDPRQVRQAWLRKLAMMEPLIVRLWQRGGPGAEQAGIWLRELEDYKVAEDLAAPQRSWRNQGSGCFPNARPPVPMEPASNVLWKANLPGAEGTAPVATASRVYLGVAPASLMCLAAGEGKPLWQVELGDGAKGPLSPPVVDGDAIFIASSSGALVCFGEDGKPRWRAKTSPGMPDAGPCVLLAGQTLIVQNGNLAAFNVSSGEPLWTADLPRGAVGAP
ncbi:MAG: PQQ-binding-like beta-propeller repeat protein, partial [Thermoguttaceae bacterium]